MKNSFYIKPRLFGWLFIVAVFVEIASFIVVGRAIGVFATLALLIIDIFLGVVLLRLQGLNLVNTMQFELAAGRMPNRQIADKVLIILAAILLIIPGFVSDILALFLFITPIRDFVWSFIANRFQNNFQSNFGTNRHYDYEKEQKNNSQKPQGKIIDLDNADYHKDNPNNNSPWKQ